MRTLLQSAIFLASMIYESATAQTETLDCGKTSFSGLKGVVTSPNFPLPYPHNLRCTYFIDVGRSNSFILKFVSFELESPYNSDRCVDDRLTISCKEKPADLERKYCGEISPNTSISRFECPTVMLQFFTGNSSSRGGFMIEYTVVEPLDCGHTSFSGPTGVVTSPNYPLPYPHNLRCTYSIDVGRNNSVMLKFVSFDLESRDYRKGCVEDWLTIACKETPADEKQIFKRQYCGGISPNTSLQFSECPIVTLQFFSGNSNSLGGFLIEYTVVENSTSADISDLDCGDTLFTDFRGLFNIPKNPTDSPAKVNCTYIISTNQTSKITIYIGSHIMEPLMHSFHDCNIENITIGCVSSDRETQLDPSTIRTYCSYGSSAIPHSPRYDVFFKCRMVKMSMRSSNYNYQGAFSLFYTVIAHDEECGNTSFTGPTGVITSPLFPLAFPQNLACVYSIDTDRTKTVSLHFLSFDLGGMSAIPESGVCYYHWLSVSCLSNDSLPKLPSQKRKYCTERATPFMLRYSNCDSVTINFVSGSFVSKGGFKLRYTVSSLGNSTPATPDEDCGNTSFTRPAGFIFPPRYPLSHPHSLECVYSIEVDRTITVTLSFLTFDMGESWLDDCNYEWLMISCLSNDSVSAVPSQNRKYCGGLPPPPELTFSNCDSLKLHLVVNTDSFSTVYGFLILYRMQSSGNSTSPTHDVPDKECGNTSFTGPAGVISSPQFPLSYPHSIDCIYSIDVGRTKTVLLNFLSFHLEGTSQYANSDSCPYDWLTISCLLNGDVSRNTSPKRKYCGERQTPLVLRYSNCDSLALYFVTDYTITKGGFQIQYTITSSGDLIVDTPSSLSGKTGHSVVISVTVIFVVVIVIVVAALFLYRRYRTKHRSEMLLHAKEEETDRLEFENDAAVAGTLFAAPCSQDLDNSGYVPLRPIAHQADSASCTHSTQFNEEMQPVILD